MSGPQIFIFLKCFVCFLYVSWGGGLQSTERGEILHPRERGQIKPTLEGAGFGMLGGKLQFLYNGGVRGVLGDRSDTGVQCALGGIHLAGANHLTVGSLQIEERLAVLGDLDLESLGNGGVLLHRLHTVEARGLRGVTFAGENDLAVGGLEIELEFTVLTESNDKFSHGFVFLMHKYNHFFPDLYGQAWSFYFRLLPVKTKREPSCFSPLSFQLRSQPKFLP